MRLDNPFQGPGAQREGPESMQLATIETSHPRAVNIILRAGMRIAEGDHADVMPRGQSPHKIKKRGDAPILFVRGKAGQHQADVHIGDFSGIRRAEGQGVWK